jgi:hypothetical protein
VNGYLKFRRSFLEHLEDGRITFSEFGVAVIIYSAANPSTGIWIGSARRLEMEYHIGSERMSRKLMEAIEHKGYIKRFAVPGRHSNYPVLCNHYELTLGVRAGMFVNAVKTKDITRPYLYDLASMGRAWGEHGASSGPLKTLDIENREKIKPRVIPECRTKREEQERQSWLKRHGHA